MATAFELLGKVDVDVGAAESKIRGLGGHLLDIGKSAAGFALGAGIAKLPGLLTGAAEAAAADAASMGNLQQAIANVSGSYDQYAGRVDQAIAKGQALAFSDDSVREALGSLTSSTGSTEEALSRLGTVQDFARAKNMDLGAAAKLFGKVTDENVTALKRYGLTVEKGATAQDLFNEADRRFGGQAARFAESDAGKLARVRDQWGELQETIGAKVLPVMANVTSALLERVFPAAVALAGQMDGPLKTAFEGVQSVAGRVIGPLHALGGFLSGALMTAWVAVRDGVVTFKQALSGNWTNSDQVTTLHRVLGELGNTIRSVAVPAWEALQKILPLVAGHFDTILAVIRILTTLAGGPVGAVLKGMIDGFGEHGLSGILPGAESGLRKFLGALQDLASLALGALQAIDWGALLGDVAGLAGTAATALADLFVGIDWGAILGDAAGLAAAAALWIASAFGAIDWTSLAGTLAGFLGAAWGALTDAATWIFQWITSGLGAIDWIGLATTLAGWLGAAWGALTDAAVWVYQWITSGLGAIDWTGLATSLANYLGVAWSALTDAATWVYAWISTGLASVDWAGIASQISTGLSGAMSALQGAADSGGILSSLGLDTIGEAIQPLIDALGPAISNLSAAFGSWREGIQGVVDAFKGLDLSAILPALQTLGTVIGAVLVVAITALTLAVRGSAEIFQILAPLLANVIVGAINTVAGTINLLVAVIGGLAKIVNDVIHGDFSAAWDDAKQMVQGAVDAITQIMGGLPAVLGQLALDILSAIVGGLASLAVDAGQAFLDLATAAGTALGGLVTDAGTKAGEILSGIVSGLATLAVDGAKAFLDLEVEGLRILGNLVIEAGTKAVDIVTGIVTALINGVTSAISAVTGIKDGIIGVFSDAVSWLTSAGGEVIQGLVNGMSGLVQWAIDQVVGFAGSIKDGAVDAFKGAFGISSPSRLFADEIGAPLIQGLVQGVTEASGMIPPALQSVADLILATANATLNAQHATFAYQGDALAKALVDGIIAGAASAGDAVAYVGDEVGLALAKMQQDLAGQVDLARIAGADPDSIAKLQTQLDATTNLLNQWAASLGITVTEALDMAGQAPLIEASWTDLLSNLDGIISGDYQKTLADAFETLKSQLAFAVQAGAPQSIIDGLTAGLAAKEAEIKQAAAAYSEAAAAGLVSEDALAGWEDAITNLGGILDGSLKDQLTTAAQQAKDQLAFAVAADWPPEVVAALQKAYAEASAKLADASEQMSIAAAAGLLTPEAQAKWNQASGALASIPLDKLQATLPKLKDFGVSLIGQIADGVTAGSIDLKGALGTLNAMVAASMSDLDESNDLTIDSLIAKLRELEGEYEQQLAQAILDGTDPSGAEANLATLEALLGGLAPALDATNQRLAEMGGYLNGIAMAVGNIASGAKSLYDALNNMSPDDGDLSHDPPGGLSHGPAPTPPPPAAASFGTTAPMVNGTYTPPSAAAGSAPVSPTHQTINVWMDQRMVGQAAGQWLTSASVLDLDLTGAHA